MQLTHQPQEVMHVPPSSLLRAVKSYMTHPMALLLNPERGGAREEEWLEKESAGEEEWPEKRSGQRRGVAREEEWPEKRSGQRKRMAREEKWPEKRSGQRREMVREKKALEKYIEMEGAIWDFRESKRILSMCPSDPA